MTRGINLTGSLPPSADSEHLQEAGGSLLPSPGLRDFAEAVQARGGIEIDLDGRGIHWPGAEEVKLMGERIRAMRQPPVSPDSGSALL